MSAPEKTDNPGKWDEVDGKAKGVLSPDAFDGVRFEFTRPVVNPTPDDMDPKLFTLTHSLSMGSTQMPAAYELGTSFQRLAQLPGYLLMGRLTMDGRVNARGFYMPNPQATARFNAQLSGEPHSSQVQADAEYRGSDWSTGLKLSNPGVVGVSYLQSVWTGLAMGGELTYLGARRMTILDFAGRYEKGRMTCVARYNTMGQVTLSSHHKINDKTALATELTWSQANKDSIYRVGYEYKLTKSTVKGLVESAGRVVATMDYKLSPGIAFLLSGELDHKKRDYKFGFGLRIGD
eukprot:tig00022075_g23610.t1